MNCIKGFLFTIAALVATSAGAAISDEPTSPALSVQGGFNFETAKNPSEISADSQTGYTAGLAVQIPLAPNLALQPEVNYSKRGINIASVGGFEADVNYHSLEVPVFARLALGETIRPYIFAGPMAVYNFSKEVRTTAGSTTASNSFNPKTLDFAAVAGVGVDFGAFFVSARYSLGLVDINENSAEYYSRGFKILAGVDL